MRSSSQPLQAGRQTIRVKNTAEQSHEVVINKLQPGKKPAAMLAWMEKMEGPPPGAPIGGTTPMARGEENIITVDLPAGEYGLLCFVSDAKDGKPHFMHEWSRRSRFRRRSKPGLDTGKMTEGRQAPSPRSFACPAGCRVA